MDSPSADTPPPIETYGSDDESDSSTVFNALVGAAVGIVLSFVPGSTVIGGAVAGYLEGGEPADGVPVGALAGFIMFLPVVLFGFFGMALFVGPAGGGGFGVFGILFLVVFGGLYTVGLSILGAVVGIFLKNDL
ncbi:DUF5518 domain-containing protein [Natronorubrum daqingense]|uniref:DUF5518 domain-containing protein n=1 Tax=Natronorubrum daqingense TaxID=588898 RepID=A0A1N7DPZ2_9EURY|nr:DUF5518 domain-containing protein [Natronorubrum daqingense]APX96105.1 hypothetical protein BB347_05430 [Natronorubrum daqingense]SIR77926.1 hypothetical protein SAMN05421809_2168 [Natronorubrum daqingense]